MKTIGEAHFVCRGSSTSMASIRCFSCFPKPLALDPAWYGSKKISRLPVFSSCIRRFTALIEPRCPSNIPSKFVSMFVNLSLICHTMVWQGKVLPPIGIQNFVWLFYRIVPMHFLVADFGRLISNCIDNSIRIQFVAERQCQDLIFQHMWLIISRMDYACWDSWGIATSMTFGKWTGLAFMFKLFMRNGFRIRMFIRPHPVMKHKCSTTLQWVSVVMSSTPWRFPNTYQYWRLHMPRYCYLTRNAT